MGGGRHSGGREGQTDSAGTIDYRRPVADDHDAIAALILAEWPARAVDAARIARWVTKSSFALVAKAGERVVGFIRVISDETSSAYIPMLVVDTAWRRQGVGRRLVEEATDGFRNPEMTWVLRARVGTERFWMAVGFRMSSRAMERVRTAG